MSEELTWLEGCERAGLFSLAHIPQHEQNLLKEQWDIDFRHRFYSSQTYKVAQRQFANSTEDEQREERIKNLERILTPNDIVAAVDTKLDAEDMENLKSLGQNLCEDKPSAAYQEHAERWQNLAVRARKLYTADPARVIFSAWQDLAAWYLKSRDALIVTVNGI